MAAFDTPWTTSMSDPSSSAPGSATHEDGARSPTVATFSPTSQTFPSHTPRSTILIHHKSPLLLATPPQVTRALAYSHPFIVPLNKFAGLLSWTTGDPWESFLLVACFWFVVLYGDEIIRYAGPLLLVTFLILGMYLRRYSPLSSTGWTGEKQTRTHRREPSEASVNHHKSLDDILSALQTLTSRCNILLDPLLRLTDFLSTQQTATSATTRPALTALFIRILFASPVWFMLTLPPLRVMTTRRTCLIFGTLVLSWHSRPARISRTILWRSRTVRLVCSYATGLDFSQSAQDGSTLGPGSSKDGSPHSAAALANMQAREQGNGIRFTFSLYQNQRRWLGIGWTSSMLAYERASWTDEFSNPTSDPEHFALPEVDGGMGKWQWVEGSVWHVEGTSGTKGNQDQTRKVGQDENVGAEAAWVYYDNKWHDGRRGQDGWGRYTRRRKWIRNAELVDAIAPPAETKTNEKPVTSKVPPPLPSRPRADTSLDKASITSTDLGSPGLGSPSSAARKSWFGRGPRDGQGRDRGNSSASVSGSSESKISKTLSTHEGDHAFTPVARLREAESEWGLGEDVSMALG